eukprot:m.31896 g.31896  ORF g.31896 m.31896 type:complete len:209 (-) comp6986_c0_seq1:3632-4258(-)
MAAEAAAVVDVTTLVPPLVPGNWPRDLEIELLNALTSHKPIGSSRHFHMTAIFHHMVGRYPGLQIEDIWAHLGKLFNLTELEEKDADTDDDPDAADDSSDEPLAALAASSSFELPRDSFFRRHCADAASGEAAAESEDDDGEESARPTRTRRRKNAPADVDPTDSGDQAEESKSSKRKRSTRTGGGKGKGGEGGKGKGGETSTKRKKR